MLEQLTAYVCGLKYEELPADVIHAAKRAVIDSLGCALGAHDAEPVQIARRLASAAVVKNGSTLIGSLEKTTPDLAAYANGTQIRYLDYNDSYSGPGGGGHPSDFLAAVLAAAEVRRASGAEVITALVAAYEVYCRMTDAGMLNETAWDYYRTFGALASSAGAAKVMALPSSKMANALALGIVPNCAFFETAVGVVSMWKACASGNAARNGVFAAMLAEEGVTGPPAPFDGRMGFFAAIGRRFDAPVMGGAARRFAILECGIKKYPCGSWSQTAVDAALQVRTAVGSPSRIRAVEVGVHPIGRQIMAGDPEKWHPSTREGADHSLPYVVGVALLQGEVTPESFSRYLDDPALAAMLAELTVVDDEDCAAAFPEAKMSRVTVTTDDAARHSATVHFHRGHEKNPLSDKELEVKFKGQALAAQTPELADRLLRSLWDLERVTDVSDLLALTQVRTQLATTNDRDENANSGKVIWT